MTRFSQGTSGNPDGRPKGSVSLTSAIRRKLSEVNPDSKRRYLEDMVDVMMEKAVKDKDFKVIKEIWNHMDGSPRQTIEQVGDMSSYDPISEAKILARVDAIFNR